MQSKNQKYYDNIIDITKKVLIALDESDPSTLRKLAHEIKYAGNEIFKKDLNDIKNIKDIVFETSAQVNSVIELVQKKLAVKREELQKVSIGKKISSAYGK